MIDQKRGQRDGSSAGQARRVQRGPGNLEAALVFGQLGELALHQRRPAGRAGAGRDQIGDLAQREPDLAQQQHESDRSHRGLGVTALAGDPGLRPETHALARPARAYVATTARSLGGVPSR